MGTSSCTRAGATIDPSIIYRAVVGIPIPMIIEATMVSMRARYRFPWDITTMKSANFSPRPVRVTVPTMRPATAQAAMTLREAFAPFASASMSCLGLSLVSFFRELTTKTITTAIKDALIV